MSMMDHDATILLELWYSVRASIPKKDRVEAASSFLRAAEDHYDVEHMANDLYGNDASIDSAMVELEMIEHDDDWTEEVDEDNLGFDE